MSETRMNSSTQPLPLFACATALPQLPNLGIEAAASASAPQELVGDGDGGGAAVGTANMSYSAGSSGAAPAPAAPPPPVPPAPLVEFATYYAWVPGQCKKENPGGRWIAKKDKNANKKKEKKKEKQTASEKSPKRQKVDAEWHMTMETWSMPENGDGGGPATPPHAGGEDGSHSPPPPAQGALVWKL